MAALDGVSMVSNLLERFEREAPTDLALEAFLIELAEVLEQATQVYYKQNHDPFDNRHPSRSYPDCTIGHVLKRIIKHGTFVDKIIELITIDLYDDDLQTVACRLLLDLLIGIDSPFFTDKEQLVNRLISLVQKASNPLQSYATCVLAAAMEEDQIATKFKEQITNLVLCTLERLNELSSEYCSSDKSVQNFVHVNNISTSVQEKPSVRIKRKRKSPDTFELPAPSSSKIRNCMPPPNDTFSYIAEHSNSSWPDMEALIIGSYQIFPLTKADEQRYIVQFLTAATQYQDLMAPFLERPLNVLRLILRYIDLKEQSDVKLAFEALKFLGSLLLYKKFATEFISKIGISSILTVPRSSLAATGVSFVLFNLSCNDDAMQTVCMLNRNVILELVGYVLSLIERSHLSGQSHSTVFLGNTFKYKPILELFDKLDGLRKLINLVSTLEVVLPSLGKDVPDIMNPDQVYSSRQLCNQVCHALKVYFEAHAETKATELRNYTKQSSASPYAKKSLIENVQTLVELLPPNAIWKPANLLLKLDGISFLLKLIAMHYDWMYQGKMDTVCSALDVLYICSVVNKVKLALCSEVQYLSHTYAEMKKIGISIILKTSLGDRYNPDVQRSALNVIINCVCHPMLREHQESNLTSKKKHLRHEEEMLNKLFNCVRANDGIFILKSLITSKQPITDADSIRALACQALCGLARSSKVMQILSKLPLITTAQLQVLMREPILKDKKVEHAKFVKYARFLISMVAGKAVSQSQIDSLMSNIKQAEVVAETIINYDENQLLQILADHLEKKGLRKSALCLREEAHLNSKSTEHIDKTNNGVKAVLEHPSPRLTTPKSSKAASAARLRLSFSGASTPNSVIKWVAPSPGPSTSGHSTRKEALPFSENIGSPSYIVENHMSSPLSSTNAPNATKSVTLHSIVTDYLRNQHAKCDNPFVTCPPFDLFEPHKCPVPHSRYFLPKNIALQMIQKQESPSLWGYNGERRARKYVSCRFREVTSYTDLNTLETICACAFDAFSERVFIGVYNGQVISFPKVNFDSESVSVMDAHESFVSNIQTTKYHPLVLTSASWRRPVSALWNVRDGFWDLQKTLSDECYAEFNKLNCDRIVTTKYERARVYDTSTGEVIYSLCQPNLTNKYTVNRATFNYTDDLILNDGVLWDVRQPSPIHKFDKLNSKFNGMFHPNGLEIVSNTEIWDLRTYRLLKTVPDLEQCQIVFDQPGHVFFAVLNHQDANTKDQSYKRYGTSVRTFDARDYTCIAMRDFFRQIHGMAIDYDSRYMSLIQSRLMDLRFREESVIRIYEIGRTLEEDDDDARGDNEDEEEDDDDDATVILQQSDDDNDDDNDNQDQDDDSFANEGDDDDNSNDDDNDEENGDDDDDDDDDDNTSQNSSTGSSSSGDHNFLFEIPIEF